MAVIETSDLSKRYHRTVAVDGISFAVEPGRVVGFPGPNGAGTTTTIGLLLGIVTPSGGSVRLFGGVSASDLHATRVRLFPFNTFSQLANYRLHRDEASRASVQRTIEGGRAIQEQGDLGFVLLMGFVWIAAFLGAAFVWFQKLDL